MSGKKLVIYSIGLMIVIAVLYFIFIGNMNPLFLLLLLCPLLHIFMHRGHKH